MRAIVRTAVAAGLLVGVAACSDDGPAAAPKQTVSASAAVEVPALVET